MTDKPASDPSARPPFPKHYIYYFVMKLVVLAAAVYLALRLYGVI